MIVCYFILNILIGLELNERKRVDTNKWQTSTGSWLLFGGGLITYERLSSTVLQEHSISCCIFYKHKILFVIYFMWVQCNLRGNKTWRRVWVKEEETTDQLACPPFVGIDCFLLINSVLVLVLFLSRLKVHVQVIINTSRETRSHTLWRGPDRQQSIDQDSNICLMFLFLSLQSCII